MPQAGSKANCGEAALVRAYLAELRRRGLLEPEDGDEDEAAAGAEGAVLRLCDVGVIAPYSAQVEVLRVALAQELGRGRRAGRPPCSSARGLGG